MISSVKNLPEDERPREKLLAYGAKSLSNIELLAILLHSGTRKKSVLQVAQELLAKYSSEGLGSIVNLPIKELIQIEGIGPAKIATLLASIELGLRLAKNPSANKYTIRTPEDVANYAMPSFRRKRICLRKKSLSDVQPVGLAD